MFFRPPSLLQLSVPFVQQRKPGECLVACAAMLCAYWGVNISYDRLMSDLRIRPDAGGLLENVRNLTRHRFSVYHLRRASLNDLYQMLENGWPPIVSVQAGEFPYWTEPPTQHAVVIVGMTAGDIWVNDPAARSAPFAVPYGDFDLAWLEMDEAFAVLTLR
jgi:ABC-type bacteriocin/lantibiotic exporter with double-glycine peptidase domain